MRQAGWVPIDVRASRELQACIIAMREAENTVRNGINREARKDLTPVWREALQANVSTRLEARTILPGAKVKIQSRQITLVAAASKRPLSGGLVPTRDWPAVELGAARKRKTVQLRSRKGTPYKATRMQGTQFKRRRKNGYVAFPAASTAGHAIIAQWVGIVIRGFERDFEIKANR